MALWVLPLALVACGEAEVPAGPSPADAEIADHASPNEAGTSLDGTATASDAGSRAQDAGGTDAVVLSPDATSTSTPDAAASDAAPPVDAESDVDAAGVDASDAGTAGDAGAADAGRADVAGGGDGGRTDGGGPCGSSLDCISGAELCADLRVVGSTVGTYCVAPNPSPPAVSVGASCTQDPECASNLCLGLTHECSLVCSDAARDCPAGFACPSYRYDPGSVWIGLCSRRCADDGECAAQTAGNVCGVATYPIGGGAWSADQVCRAPRGSVPLGGACVSGSDCRSNLCLTFTRTGVADCGGCRAGETCGCSNGGAPPCQGGGTIECVARGCTAICNDATDCAAGGLFNSCDTVNLSLPDGSALPLRTCTEP